MARAMLSYLNKAREPTPKRGKQSVRSLAKDGSSLADAELDNDDIRSFERVARKYHVDYALQRDRSAVPPRCVVFFRAKDSRAIDSAFKEFSRLALLPQQSKPSLMAKLQRFKELAAAMASPVRNRSRGEREL